MKSLIVFNVLVFALTYAQGSTLEIIKLGHPTLLMVAQELGPDEIASPETQKLMDDMIETMKEARGVGLAAPQVNVGKRLFVMKPSLFKKAQVVVNPVVDYDEERGMKSSSEGCLSIPNETFVVERYKRIRVSYYDRKGRFVTEVHKGLSAIVFQHEYDHLNGILISDFFTSVIPNSLVLKSLAPLM